MSAGRRRTFEVNLLGLLHVTQALPPALATRPSHVDLDELVIDPRAQAAQHKVHRES